MHRKGAVLQYGECGAEMLRAKCALYEVLLGGYISVVNQHVADISKHRLGGRSPSVLPLADMRFGNKNGNHILRLVATHKA